MCCKQKRKIRKKAAEPDEGALDLAALEAEAAAADGSKDRGSRADKLSKDAKQAQAREKDLQERKERLADSFMYSRAKAVLQSFRAGVHTVLLVHQVH